MVQEFAQKLYTEQGGVGALGIHWAERFIKRDTELKRQIGLKPPNPVLTDTKYGRLLRATNEQRRVKAVFGNETPPERVPAPYPEGQVVHKTDGDRRVVVRHGPDGCWATKYTTSTIGLGTNEAAAVRFIQAHTTIPVAECVAHDWDRITTRWVDGEQLGQAWPRLTPVQREGILDQLRDYIRQLHGVPLPPAAAAGEPFIGRLNGDAAVHPGIFQWTGGPFRTVKELHAWLLSNGKRGPPEGRSHFWQQLTSRLADDVPIHFTHGDLAGRNIIVRDGRVAAIIDWERAGWYPAYWEYFWAIRGLDTRPQDWGTLGQHIPTLFPTRYDLEYIFLYNLARLT
ncbi:hypothetical protein P8C59_001610 [Phyllachora maydis]|uniref:HTH CENPB-type domain-containing protein n=1 Tax=Phyllachora maydis TaxID=1825666 RepID=A0AAD9HYP9_9PEZI|nr:hypothetical protein P8C59_001610 [Phyllachora maydis]